ncbi:MAG: CPBP family intramembrane metalloprotease [Burkholderiales bacterium]|nr:MAG: CPBP family intramembrane metalloprotease [Burkholderiales bacterium]
MTSAVAAPPRAVPGALAMFWLLTRLRLRRLVNLTGAMSRLSFGRKKAAAARTGTARKGGTGWLLAMVMGLLMLGAFGSVAVGSFEKLHQVLDVQPQDEADREANGEVSKEGEKFSSPGPVSQAFSPPLLAGTAGLLTLLVLMAVCNDLGTRELARPEWDLEWLLTLPVGLTALLWARLVERSVTSVFAWLALLPLCTVLAWKSGVPWWASPGLGLVACLPLCLLAALLRSLVDIGLRLHLSPPRLRNLQALMSVVGLLGMYLALSIGTSRGGSYGVELVSALPGWALWTPPGLVVRALNAAQPGAGLLLLVFAAAQVVVLSALGVAWMRHQLRHGLLAVGHREAGGRQGGVAAAPAKVSGRPFIRSAIQRRELRLLARDRNFLVQTLLLPVLIIGSQVVMNGGWQAVAALFSASPPVVASAAFGLASYMLMLSAFQTLNNEGAALWLLYTFPRSIGQTLKEKAQLWAALALVYVLCILVPAAWQAKDGAGWQLLGPALLALVGVPLFAVIAVSLAVFASDPLAEERAARVRPGYIYLFMLLGSFYAYGLWAAQWWQSLIIVLLTGLLALALWQKATDQLPFLLDPTASPPARPSVADGVMAAMCFFICQLVLAALWQVVMPGHAVAGLLAVFLAAGAFTYGLVRLAYWRTGTRSLPEWLGAPGSRVASLRSGAGLGVLAAAAGLAYVGILQVLELAPAAPAALAPGLRLGLLLLCVLAAPVFEEFIFRGLIFGGLRRSLPLWPAAAASAAVFAIVHPPISVIPVFFLGLCTALAFERGRSLLAPMVVHAIYNAAVVGWQFLAAP